jgi:hypothetical protein
MLQLSDNVNPGIDLFFKLADMLTLLLQKDPVQLTGVPL